MDTLHTVVAVSPNSQPRRWSLLGLQVDLRAVAIVVSTFLVTRMILLTIVFFSSAVIPMPTGPYGYASPDNLLLDGLVRHDSWWYVFIVEYGYTIGNVSTGEQGTVTFFPLYPLLVKQVAGLTGNVFLAGVVVSNLAFLATLGFLYGLARREYDDETAARAILYLAAAPSSIFFSAMYTESLFVALICATFYFSQRRMWEWAAAAGALAAATRNTGVLVAVVIALEGLTSHGFRFLPERWFGATLRETLLLWWRHLWLQIRLALASWPSLLAAGYVAVGLIAYMAFLQVTFGDPLAFIHAQATWGRTVAGTGLFNLPNNIMTNLGLGPNPWIGQFNTLTVLNVVSTFGFLPLVIGVLWKMRPAYGWYAALTIYVPLSTGSVGSMTRYVLMLMPCFLLLAVWGKRSWVDRMILAIFLPWSAYFAILFSHWYFVG